MIFWSGANQGPVVLPGTYTVRLTVGDEVRERQRDRRDLEKRLQQHVYRRGTVEKDW